MFMVVYTRRGFMEVINSDNLLISSYGLFEAFTYLDVRFLMQVLLQRFRTEKHYFWTHFLAVVSCRSRVLGAIASVLGCLGAKRLSIGVLVNFGVGIY